MGTVPTGGATHILLAFATKECMDNDDGTDAVDKALWGNHTLKYMLRSKPIPTMLFDAPNTSDQSTLQTYCATTFSGSAMKLLKMRPRLSSVKRTTQYQTLALSVVFLGMETSKLCT